MRSASLLLALLPALALADGAKDLNTGKAEALKTGKPIFLITIWPPGT